MCLVFFNLVSYTIQKHSWLKLLYQHMCCNPLGFWIWLVASLAQFLCLACLNILPSFSSPFSSASSRQIKLGGFDWCIMHDCWVENAGSFSKVYHSGSNSGFSQRVSETQGWGLSGELAGLFYSCFFPKHCSYPFGSPARLHVFPPLQLI